MSWRYDDDEMVDEVHRDIDDGTDVVKPMVPGIEAFLGGKTFARFANKTEAKQSETNLKVFIELTGSADAKHRAGLDLVMVLDASGSMSKYGRIEQQKIAMKFVIKKLSPMDRLSIVKYSNHAERLCPLRQMTPDAHAEIEYLLSSISNARTTNMTEALEVALGIVNDRKFTEGRQAAIMFLSDGAPYPTDKDGSLLDISQVPVYTFGLGSDTDHEVLQKMAMRSKFGSFSFIEDGEENNEMSIGLAFAFSQCLAGLQTVVVQDLTLTITPQPKSSRIIKVIAGRYEPSEISSEESVTLSFGDLYSKETRNLLVELNLDEVTNAKGTDVLEFTYSYKDPVTKELFQTLPVVVGVSRSDYATADENLEVLLKETHHQIIEMMKQARALADDNDFEAAKRTINHAKSVVEQVNDGKSDPMMKLLEPELAQFLRNLESPMQYKKYGRAFALAGELCHDLQRYAARGNVNELRLFATDAMSNVVNQVKEYANNPNDYKVPTSAEDAALVKQADDDGKRDENAVK